MKVIQENKKCIIKINNLLAICLRMKNTTKINNQMITCSIHKMINNSPILLINSILTMIMMKILP